MDATKLMVKVAGRATEVASTAHGLPGGGIVVEALLGDLLKIQDEQAQALSRIEKDVQRLVGEPWLTAQLHLQECLLPDRPVELVVDSLRAASQHLRRAFAMHQKGGLPAAYAAFDLAIVLALLSDREASCFYARASVTAMTDAVNAAERAHKTASPRSRREKGYYIPVPGLAEEWLSMARSAELLCTDFSWLKDEHDRLLQGGPQDAVDDVRLRDRKNGIADPWWMPASRWAGTGWDAYDIS
jgi:hypothetical protein